MSSRRSSNDDPDGSGRPIGLGFSLRLGTYYGAFFSIAAAALFGATYYGVAGAIRDRELEIVRNRAAEYRAWFLKGDTEMLERRMREQSLESGDVMFVRIRGEGLNYVSFKDPSGGKVPIEGVQALEASAEGAAMEIGGSPWAVASLPIGDRGLILQAGKNARAEEATLQRMRRVFVSTLIFAIIAVVLGGALLTYRSLAPIRRLITAMRGILKAGDLSQRAETEPGRNELNALVSLFNRMLARNETLIDGMHGSLDSVAHDLRTPLNRVKNTAERALREGATIDELRDALADCAEESDYITSLVNTLMDVAEAESGAMRLEREMISLPDLVENVTELYEFVAEERKIDIVTDLPDELIVNADRTRLTRALANVLDNAIKYSNPGGDVRIAVRERAVGGAQIEVADHGIGIGEADLPYVWDRLFRAERSRTAQGMGLGLSFVRAIIEAHGGEVSVESELGKGSTFKLTLTS